MSFTVPPSPPARPNRCQLFGPGSRPELFPKMAASAADVVNLDLEDSVPPADKAAARANVIAALEAGLPSIVLAGQVLVGRRETMGLGISGTYAVAETPEQVDAALLDPVGTLRARAARVARTWSPGR